MRRRGRDLRVSQNCKNAVADFLTACVLYQYFLKIAIPFFKNMQQSAKKGTVKQNIIQFKKNMLQMI